MVSRHSAVDVAAAGKLLADLQADAAAALDREGFRSTVQQFIHTADLRYYGQAFEVRVPLDDGVGVAEGANTLGPVTGQLLETTADAFHAEHRALYGYDFRDDPRQEVEWVNLRVTGVGPIRRPDIREIERGGGAELARTGARDVYFDDWTETPIYDRSLLGAGDVIAGPAIIEEFGSTVPVHPGFSAEVDRHGNLRMVRR